MTDSSVKKEILEEISKLRFEEQQRVLSFARSLVKTKAKSKSVGVPGKELLRFAGAIEKKDLQQIAKAIEEGCEKVNLNEW